MPKLLWLLHCQNASPGFNQQLANFCPPTILPPVSGSRCWACCPREPMTYVVSPPQSRSTVTGLSPRFWSLPLGAPVRCSHHFIFVTFNTNMMAFFLWVRLWLRVRGSGSPHLLTCSGGGGGSTLPLSPLPRGSFTCFSGWMRGLPIQ